MSDVRTNHEHTKGQSASKSCTSHNEGASFAEFEVAPNMILIRRDVSDELRAKIIEIICSTMSLVADGLANERAHCDGEMSAEHAYLSALDSVAENIRRAIIKSQHL